MNHCQGSVGDLSLHIEWWFQVKKRILVKNLDYESLAFYHEDWILSGGIPCKIVDCLTSTNLISPFALFIWNVDISSDGGSVTSQTWGVNHNVCHLHKQLSIINLLLIYCEKKWVRVLLRSVMIIGHTKAGSLLIYSRFPFQFLSVASRICGFDAIKTARRRAPDLGELGLIKESNSMGWCKRKDRKWCNSWWRWWEGRGATGVIRNADLRGRGLRWKQCSQ